MSENTTGEYGTEKNRQPTDRGHDLALATDGGEDQTLKQLLVKLDADLHAKFKAKTKRNGETMADVVRAMVREYVGTEPEHEAEQARKEAEEADERIAELEEQMAEMQDQMAEVSEQIAAERERKQAALDRAREARAEAERTEQERAAEREEALLEVEDHVRSGGHIFPEFRAVTRAAEVCNTTPAEVIETIRERNPNVPDYAFREGRLNGKKWRGLRYPDRADDPEIPDDPGFNGLVAGDPPDADTAAETTTDAEAATDGGTDRDRDPDREGEGGGTPRYRSISPPRSQI